MRRGTRYLIVTAGMLAAIGVAGVFALSLPQFGAELTGERLARARANPHYRDGAFVNPLPPASYRFADAWNLFRGQFSATRCACRRARCRSSPSMLPR